MNFFGSDSLLSVLVITVSNATALSGGESQKIWGLCARTTARRANSQWMKWIMRDQRKKTMKRMRRRAQRNSRSQTRQMWATQTTSCCILYPSVFNATLASRPTCPGVRGAEIPACRSQQGACEDGAASSQRCCQSKWPRVLDAGTTAGAASQRVSISHSVLCFPPTNEHTFSSSLLWLKAVSSIDRSGRMNLLSLMQSISEMEDEQQVSQAKDWAPPSFFVWAGNLGAWEWF